MYLVIGFVIIFTGFYTTERIEKKAIKGLLLPLPADKSVEVRVRQMGV